MIKKNEFIELSKIHNAFCISIYIPTHRAGEETLKGKDILVFKNQIKETKKNLAVQGLSDREINNLLKPATDLAEDLAFWKHQSDGLAIFISDNFFRKFSLPLNFEEFSYVSNDFYLKPLMPVLNNDGSFYLLTLKADEVKFYEGTEFSITEIRIGDLVPSSVEDRVGHDHKQKNLQFRTQQGGKGEGMFHGHDAANSEEKNEILRFFRAVDKGLMTMIHDTQKPPLVICSLDYYFPIYKEVNTYQNLFPQHISGNPSDMDVMLLHEKAVELLKPSFNKKRSEKSEMLLNNYNNGKTSSDLKEIITAAFLGQVDTVFLENRSDIFGIYKTSTQEIEISDEFTPPNVSLMNLLAVTVFDQNGTVFLTDKDKMPDDSSKVNALFRY